MMIDLSDSDNEILETNFDEDDEAKNDEHQEENKEAEDVGVRLETEEEEPHDQGETANDIRNTIGEKFQKVQIADMLKSMVKKEYLNEITLFGSSLDITTCIREVEKLIGCKIQLNEVSYLISMNQRSFAKLQKMLINQLQKVFKIFITQVKAYEICLEEDKKLFSKAVRNYMKRQGCADITDSLNRQNSNLDKVIGNIKKVDYADKKKFKSTKNKQSYFKW